MKSIQSKILVVVISALLVMTAVVSTIGVYMTHGIMHKDAERILKNACQKEAAQINETMNDIIKSVIIMEHYATTELDSVQQLKDEVYREEYLEKMKNLYEEVALNTQDIEAFYFRLSPEYSNSTAGFFKGVDRKTQELKEYATTDLSQYPATDMEHVGWYYAAIQSQGGTWLEPYKNRVSHESIISYVMPFYHEGALAGVIGMDINFTKFIQSIERITVYERGYAILTNGDGTVAYNHQDVWKQKVESQNPYTEQTTVLANGMNLTLRADYKDIQKDIFPVLYRIVAAFVVVLGAFILYTIVVTQRIVAPLKKLTASAQSIIDGEKEIDLSTDSNDEIGTLSRVLSETFQKLREYMNYINALAYRDSLTGVKNRTAYTEAIEEFEKRIHCGNPCFAVLVADINDLKKVNDQYGHDVGNELIIHTARILCNTFRNSPVFRIGGDEFVVILENHDLENYHKLVERLDQDFARDSISFQDKEIKISIARGVATYNPNIDQVFGDVFTNADHAMYMHKQNIKEKKES